MLAAGANSLSNLATDQRAHPEREAHPAPIAIAPVPGESRTGLAETNPALQNVMSVASTGRYRCILIRRELNKRYPIPGDLSSNKDDEGLLNASSKQPNNTFMSRIKPGLGFSTKKAQVGALGKGIEIRASRSRG